MRKRSEIEAAMKLIGTSLEPKSRDPICNARSSSFSDVENGINPIVYQLMAGPGAGRKGGVSQKVNGNPAKDENETATTSAETPTTLGTTEQKKPPVNFLDIRKLGQRPLFNRGTSSAPREECDSSVGFGADGDRYEYAGSTTTDDALELDAKATISSLGQAGLFGRSKSLFTSKPLDDVNTPKTASMSFTHYDESESASGSSASISTFHPPTAVQVPTKFRLFSPKSHLSEDVSSLGSKSAQSVDTEDLPPRKAKAKSQQEPPDASSPRNHSHSRADSPMTAAITSLKRRVQEEEKEKDLEDKALEVGEAAVFGNPNEDFGACYLLPCWLWGDSDDDNSDDDASSVESDAFVDDDAGCCMAGTTTKGPTEPARATSKKKKQIKVDFPSEVIPATPEMSKEGNTGKSEVKSDKKVVRSGWFGMWGRRRMQQGPNDGQKKKKNRAKRKAVGKAVAAHS